MVLLSLGTMSGYTRHPANEVGGDGTAVVGYGMRDGGIDCPFRISRCAALQHIGWNTARPRMKRGTERVRR